MSNSSLPYTIISATSQHPLHPARHLSQSPPSPSGWKTTQHPQYPVSLFIAFPQQQYVSHLQIIAHQFNIPESIYIYYSPGGNFEEMRKLGYFRMLDNRERDFRSRELKTVQVNVRAQFLRLEVRGSHKNAHNQFDQVQLMSLQFFGEALNHGSDGVQRQNRARPDLKFDSRVLQQLNEFEKQKQIAIQQQDYQQANFLKQSIDRLYLVQRELDELEQQKASAVEREQYVRAQQLKQKISVLKQSLSSLGESGSPPDHFPSNQ